MANSEMPLVVLSNATARSRTAAPRFTPAAPDCKAAALRKVSVGAEALGWSIC